jgi:hypothetical protein
MQIFLVVPFKLYNDSHAILVTMQIITIMKEISK